jgi:hypothetical protein
VGVLRIAVREQRDPPAERRERAEIAAGGMAEHADPVGRDVEVLGVAAHKLNGGQHVMHRVREGFLLGRGKAVADREQRDAARGQIFTPVLELAPRALDPAAAVHAN